MIEVNAEFQRALDLLNGKSHVFITGKAGTGKSTLLRHYLDHTPKGLTVVAAPTGVAALNVGGETLHRVFGFKPGTTTEWAASSDYRPSSKTRALLESMECLVIDEVSMVRADFLDSVDIALRRFGPRKSQPFGGVQMVMVGDPYQLPPVVSEQEENYFRTHYATPYFFSSDALRELDFHIVELLKIYRQQDDRFIYLLNAIRTGDAGPDIFDQLNTRYDPSFEPPPGEFWVTLTTSNRMADDVNRKALSDLPGNLHTHRARVSGDVAENEKSVPENLEYKAGSQVMLVNNDFAGRWVNGSMGVIRDVHVEDGTPVVQVEVRDSGKLVEIRPHTWEITRPSVSEGRITYDVVGTYSQLPFKPAWAITIHKSQGQTLDRAIIYLGRGTFADGQLYVALSRCTSLNGLILKSEVRSHHVKVEREVSRFLARHRGDSGHADGWAIIGAHTTGTTRHDRVIEIGVVVHRLDGEVTEFSTMVNPMRDIGRSAEDYGISATDVEMAPTFAEAWPWIARRIEGCAIAAINLPNLQTMIEREAERAPGLERIDLGLGVDVADFARRGLVGQDEINQALHCRRALDIARETNIILSRIAPQEIPAVTGYRPRGEARLPGRMSSRDTITPSVTGGGNLAYYDTAMQAATSLVEEFQAKLDLARYAQEFEISDSQATLIRTSVMDSLVEAAQRDRVISSAERQALMRAARVLDQPMPDLPDTDLGGGIPGVLAPGAQVCFTGSAVDSKGEELERSVLHSLAESRGLIPVKSVTKKTAAVVAADPASMSGKAKKARDLGTPVFGVDEFLRWLADS